MTRAATFAPSKSSTKSLKPKPELAKQSERPPFAAVTSQNEEEPEEKLAHPRRSKSESYPAQMDHYEGSPEAPDYVVDFNGQRRRSSIDDEEGMVAESASGKTSTIAQSANWAKVSGTTKAQTASGEASDSRQSERPDSGQKPRSLNGSRSSDNKSISKLAGALKAQMAFKGVAKKRTAFKGMAAAAAAAARGRKDAENETERVTGKARASLSKLAGVVKKQAALKSAVSFSPSTSKSSTNGDFTPRTQQGSVSGSDSTVHTPTSDTDRSQIVKSVDVTQSELTLLEMYRKGKDTQSYLRKQKRRFARESLEKVLTFLAEQGVTTPELNAKLTKIFKVQNEMTMFDTDADQYTAEEVVAQFQGQRRPLTRAVHTPSTWKTKRSNGIVRNSRMWGNGYSRDREESGVEQEQTDWHVGWRVIVEETFTDGLLHAREGVVGTIMQSVVVQCGKCDGSGTVDWGTCSSCIGSGRRDYIEVRFDGDMGTNRIGHANFNKLHRVSAQHGLQTLWKAFGKGSGSVYSRRRASDSLRFLPVVQC